MSGIYILKTIDGYRVAYSNRYDDFFGAFNDDTIKYEPNKVAIKEVFGLCYPFELELTALDAAMRISSLYDETDDGIMFIKDYQNYTFKELTND
jgi:hypothetical protein